MENKLYLRGFEYSDLNFLNKIRNDDIIFPSTTGNKYYISSEHDKKWIEDKIFNNYSQLYLVICCSESHTPIGYLSANNIDYINRKAELGGTVVTKEYNCKGIATGATYLFLNHLFGELGLNMVYAYIKEDNTASNRLPEKFGLKKDGIIRDFVYKQNRYHNVFIYTMLKSEFESLQVPNIEYESSMM